MPFEGANPLQELGSLQALLTGPAIYKLDTHHEYGPVLAIS